MELEQIKKRTLVSSIISFLLSETANKNSSDEKKESIEVAVQCLENAYDLGPEEREGIQIVDLLTQIPDPEPVIDKKLEGLAEDHKHLGNAAMKSGNYEEAVLQYTQAIECNPKNAVYYCNRAAAYSRLNDNQEAIKDCKAAIKLDRTYGKAYGRLGIAYSNLDMWPEATRAYELSLKYDPDNESYKTNLRLSRDRLFASMENAAPPQHRPQDIHQFINHESFLSVAREMMTNPDFQNLMSGIMAMSQSGDTNLEALFQAGQDLANRMSDQNPNFVESLRRHFAPSEPSSGSGDSNKRDSDKGPNGDV